LPNPAIAELELDAAEFDEMHGVLVDEIDTEERGAYTELNAIWSSDELGPALKQMKHYKAAGEDGIVADGVHEIRGEGSI
jgi:hypothetical protein